VDISLFDGKIQGFFGADRIGEEPSALPRGDPVELRESGQARTNWSTDLPDVARRDIDQFFGNSERKRLASRVQ
jgi:hypothetical protein